jgi:hypothetical protein
MPGEFEPPALSGLQDHKAPDDNQASLASAVDALANAGGVLIA